jgi:hypothetical protein
MYSIYTTQDELGYNVDINFNGDGITIKSEYTLRLSYEELEQILFLVKKEKWDNK